VLWTNSGCVNWRARCHDPSGLIGSSHIFRICGFSPKMGTRSHPGGGGSALAGAAQNTAAIVATRAAPAVILPLGREPNGADIKIAGDSQPNKLHAAG
jgi:hypothetical protein